MVVILEGAARSNAVSFFLPLFQHNSEMLRLVAYQQQTTFLKTATISNMDRPPNQNQLLDGQVLESSEEQEQEGGEQATARSLTGRPPIILYLSFDHGAFPPFQLLVRRNIEFFEALPIDVETSVQGRPRPILLGQVGLRCIFCASLQPSIRRKLVQNHNETEMAKLDSTAGSHILLVVLLSGRGYMLSSKVFWNLSSGAEHCQYSLGNAVSYGAI